MSLDFDVSEVRNFEVITSLKTTNNSTRWHPMTTSIIWATMAVDMGEITVANWKEFYFRLNYWSKLVTDEPTAYCPLDVYMHIGLRTNVVTITRAKFLKKVQQILERELDKELTKTPVFYAENNLGFIKAHEWQTIWSNPESKLDDTTTKRILDWKPSESLKKE